MKTKYIKKEEFVALFLKEWAQAVLFALAGLLSSNALIFGTLAPFSVALVSAASGVNMYAAVIGAVVGSFFFESAGIVIKYIGAIIFVVAIKLFLSYKTAPLLKWWIMPTVAFVSLSFSGGVLAALTRADSFVYLSLLVESTLTFFSVLFFENTLNAITHRRPLCRLDTFTLCSVVVSVCVLIIALENLSSPFLILGRIAAGYLTLVIALNSGGASGAATGIIMGVALALSNTGHLSLFAPLAFGGFLAGVFKHLGKSKMVLIFIVSGVLALLISQNDANLLKNALSLCLSSGLFLAYAPNSQYLKNLANPNEHVSNTEDLRQYLNRRIMLTAESLTEIGDITKRVSLSLDKSQNGVENVVFEKVAGDVCDRCTMHDYCWDGHREKVKSAFLSLLPALKQNGAVTLKDGGEYFETQCCKSPQIISSINQTYLKEIELLKTRDELSSVRQIICEQFDATAMMLAGLCDELKSVKSVKGDLSDKIGVAFREMGLDVEYVCANERNFERIAVEVCVGKIENESIPHKNLVKALNELTSRDYDYPSIAVIGEKIHYTFNEKACLDFDYHIEQTSLNQGEVSGDSIGCFCDCEQFFNVVISDGMGSGRRAAVDSKMTVSLITKLIKSGFLYHNAINVVNSAMLVKSSEETLSSVDAMNLDLYTGRAQFSKCGAAPTFVFRQNNRVSVIENSALPIGILGGVKPSKDEMYLKAGDIVVMVTDGICDEEYIWLENLIMRHNTRTPKEICHFIMNETQKNNPNPDDRTVMVGRVVANG